MPAYGWSLARWREIGVSATEALTPSVCNSNKQGFAQRPTSHDALWMTLLYGLNLFMLRLSSTTLSPNSLPGLCNCSRGAAVSKRSCTPFLSGGHPIIAMAFENLFKQVRIECT